MNKGHYFNYIKSVFFFGIKVLVRKLIYCLLSKIHLNDYTYSELCLHWDVKFDAGCFKNNSYQFPFVRLPSQNSFITNVNYRKTLKIVVWKSPLLTYV